MKLDLVADGTDTGGSMNLMGIYVTVTSLVNGYRSLVKNNQWPVGSDGFILDHDNRKAFRILADSDDGKFAIEELVPSLVNALGSIVKAADRSTKEDQFETLVAAKLYVAKKGWKHSKHIYVKCRNGSYTVVFEK